MFLGDEHAFSTAHYLRYVIEEPYPSEGSYDYDVVGVYDKWVKIASKSSKSLVIQTPHGEEIFFPKEIKSFMKPYKKIMNIPTVPMKLYSLKVGHREHSPDERWEG